MKRSERIFKDRVSNRIRLIVFLILIGVIVIFSVVYLFLSYEGKTCEDLECFRDSMIACDKAKYLNEEPEATWRYAVKGLKDENCIVEVTLLQTKQGELGLDKLSGMKMECEYPNGVFAYPEKNLDNCHGRLKEEFQNVIINKLHTYILENLGDIDDNLNLF